MAANAKSRRSQSKSAPRPGRVMRRILPRHAPFYFSLAFGAVVTALSFWLVPKFAISLGSNTLFVVFLGLTGLKMPHLSADFLRKHAREEDTPVGGIFFIVFVVVAASIVSLVLALSGGGKPDPWEIAASLTSVLLGWFTVQVMGALHYAYEYYEEPEDGRRAVEGGLGFRGGEDPNGMDFLYFSFTVGTSVATSDTAVESHRMRKLVTGHLVFSHLYNTIILASAVNVMLSIGGG